MKRTPHPATVRMTFTEDEVKESLRVHAGLSGEVMPPLEEITILGYTQITFEWKGK